MASSLLPPPLLPCSSSRRPRLSRATQALHLKPFHPELKRDVSPRNWRQRHGPLVRGAAALDKSPVLEPPPQPEGAEPEVVASLKLKLLSALSGLNRGLAAFEEDLRRVDSAAKELEAVGGVVDLTKDLDKLQGRWKLIYSSAFSSRALSRPGLLTGRLIPITLGQVFQRIDILSKDFDIIAELQIGTPWPFPVIEATATLAHKFELIGNSNIKITFEKTIVKPTGSFSQLPPLEVPRLPDALRPPSNTGSSEFEVTYLDADTRITRGDREELRVCVTS